jgi:hypothetical protein
MIDLEEPNVIGRQVGGLAERLGVVRDRQRRGEPLRVRRAPRPLPPRLKRPPLPKWKR